MLLSFIFLVLYPFVCSKVITMQKFGCNWLPAAGLIKSNSCMAIAILLAS